MNGPQGDPGTELPLRRFDLKALHAALESARRARGLGWAELAAEINRPFRGTSSLPIGVATIRGMPNRRTVASAVVLQVLRWLGRSPESFLSGPGPAPRADEMLPDPGPARILRFDTRALHAALNAERVARGTTWKRVAAELPGFKEGMLTHLATGPLIGFPQAMMIAQWLGRPAASFVLGRRR